MVRLITPIASLIDNISSKQCNSKIEGGGRGLEDCLELQRGQVRKDKTNKNNLKKIGSRPFFKKIKKTAESQESKWESLGDYNGKVVKKATMCI